MHTTTDEGLVPLRLVILMLKLLFCMQNSQPSFVAFECKTATLEPELQVSMGPSPHLFLLLFKTETLAPELQVTMGSRPHLWFCAFKTATLASELLVSMGPSPHLWFLQAKQRLLDQNYTSLWVPDFAS